MYFNREVHKEEIYGRFFFVTFVSCVIEKISPLKTIEPQSILQISLRIQMCDGNCQRIGGVIGFGDFVELE